ncbi:MAG: hypothetical protein LBN39_02810 [Planctomycetaceae bacterium]|jgi:hypothetical protein|nr:hypothetical protein [Planctomycetaceae bacterium]
MRTLFLLTVLFTVTAVFAEEQAVKPQTVSVALFKNGYTIVQQEFAAPTAGIYRWDEIPAVIHGTFFVESNQNVEIRTTVQTVQQQIDTKNPAVSLADLAEKDVVVFKDEAGGEKRIEGTFVLPQSTWQANSLLPGLSTGHQEYYPANPVSMMQEKITVRQTDGRYTFLNGYTRIETVKPITERTVRKPVMLFDVKGNNGKVRLFYLTKGTTWMPSYRVDIQDGKKLQIEQTAQIRNESSPLSETDIALVSGFPQIETRQVLSPLSPQQTLAAFFSQLIQQQNRNLNPSRYNDDFMGNSAMMQQQAVYSPRATADLGFDTSSLAAGEGPDIYYHHIGKKTLDTGDTLSLSTGKGETEYRRVLECNIAPQILTWCINDNYRHSENGDQRFVPPDVWDVLKFKNPLPFPMTTAPAMITEQSRFLGQSQSRWVNPGQVASVKITKVMNVRVSYEEQKGKLPENGNAGAGIFGLNGQLAVPAPLVAQKSASEVPSPFLTPSRTALTPADDTFVPPSITPAAVVNPQPAAPSPPQPRQLTFRGYTYYQQPVVGRIDVINQRNEEITLELDGVFLGSNLQIEPKPWLQRVQPLINQDQYGPNEMTDLSWKLTLKPGEKMSVTITGTRWVRQ